MFPETALYNLNNHYPGCLLSSCDGILLFDVDSRPPLLWNPSIRKFKILPPFLKPPRGIVIYTFGYDHFIDNYKIFAVSSYLYKSEVGNYQHKTEVSVYTLGYDSWRRIDDFPCDGLIFYAGIFVGGTVNWLSFDASGSSSHVLVSLDLEKESYQKLLTPNLNTRRRTLGVLMDCLCIFTNGDESLDVWVMKEYGIKESWTKLFSVSYKGFGGTPGFYYYMVVYVSEDDLVLLERKVPVLDSKLIVYNFRNGTFKIPKVQNTDFRMVPKVYVESLISPCS